MAGLFLFDGESGGVGKSTATRAFLEYARMSKWKNVRLHDLDTSKLDVGLIYDPTRYKTEDTSVDKLSSFIRFTERSTSKSKVNALFEEALTQNVVVNLPSNIKPMLDAWLIGNNIAPLTQKIGLPFIKFFVCSGQKSSIDLFLQSLETHAHHGIYHVFVLNTAFDVSFEDVKQISSTLKQKIEVDKIVTMSLPSLDEQVYATVRNLNLTLENAGQNYAEMGILGASSVYRFIEVCNQQFSPLFESLKFKSEKSFSMEQVTKALAGK
ncbi:MAG: hypothetical protein RLZZ381_1209 [Cyanobacteriota bacterium]|jgi:hypothetical protein